MKADLKTIRKEIKESTIPEELKILYLLASSVELINADAYRRCQSVYIKHGVHLVDNPLLSGLKDYCEAVKTATWHFFHRIEPMVSGATFEAIYDREKPETIDEASEAYDQFSRDANEICRLMLLYIDRTARSEEAYGKVFKTLRQLPSSGIINDEDISRFKLQ